MKKEDIQSMKLIIELLDGTEIVYAPFDRNKDDTESFMFSHIPTFGPLDENNPLSIYVLKSEKFEFEAVYKGQGIVM